MRNYRSHSAEQASKSLGEDGDPGETATAYDLAQRLNAGSDSGKPQHANRRDAVVTLPLLFTESA